MIDLPTDCLAVRQPWAWALIHAGKDVENRSWNVYKADWKFRGRVAILASRGLTQAEYWGAAEDINSIRFRSCPAPADLIRGAIIGSVEIYGKTRHSDSPWFVGPGALLVRNPIPCEPVPVDGQLGFFKWRRAPRGLIPPAKWMLPPVPRGGALL